jgi:hypothetical protein
VMADPEDGPHSSSELARYRSRQSRRSLTTVSRYSR